MIEFKRKENESRLHFIWRVYSYQRDVGGITNEECGKICRNELNESFDESAYRKTAQAFFSVFDEVKHEYLSDEAFENRLEEIEKREEELYKQQVKTRDAVREHRGLLRTDSRIEVLVDAIKDVVVEQPQLKINKNFENGDTEAILFLSDFHIGAEVNNFYNSYNLNIAKERVSKLVSDTIKYCKRNNVSKLNVVSLGDLLEGNIHVTTRIQSELDVIEQVMKCAEIVSHVLNELNNNIEEVNFRYCLDNHGRINAFKEHIEKENFGKLVYWYVEERLKDTDIIFYKNQIDDNIGYFKLDNGKNFFFEHGHQGSTNSKFQEVAFATNIIPDYIAIGHYHHTAMKEFQGKKMFICGSMKGADDYSLSKRLFSKPSQTLLVFDEDNDIRFDINL